MRDLVSDVQAPFGITTTNQLLAKEKGVGQDVFFQNNHATGIAYVNLSGKAGLALAYTSGGVIEITVGDTIVGESGGATGLVVAVTLLSGTWAGGNAVGFLYIDTKTGTFQSETLKVGTDLNLATITADTDDTHMIKVLPGGGVFERLRVVNEVYVFGSEAFYVPVVIGALSGQS